MNTNPRSKITLERFQTNTESNTIKKKMYGHLPLPKKHPSKTKKQAEEKTYP